jgi:hypothetical protein
VTETSVYEWRERFDNAELNALPAEAFRPSAWASVLSSERRFI